MRRKNFILIVFMFLFVNILSMAIERLCQILIWVVAVPIFKKH